MKKKKKKKKKQNEVSLTFLLRMTMRPLLTRNVSVSVSRNLFQVPEVMRVRKIDPRDGD